MFAILDTSVKHCKPVDMCRKLRIGEVRPVATLRQTKSQLNFVWEKDGEDAPTLQLADQETRAAASLCAHVELTEIHEEYARSGKRTVKVDDREIV